MMSDFLMSDLGKSMVKCLMPDLMMYYFAKRTQLKTSQIFVALSG